MADAAEPIHVNFPPLIEEEVESEVQAEEKEVEVKGGRRRCLLHS